MIIAIFCEFVPLGSSSRGEKTNLTLLKTRKLAFHQTHSPGDHEGHWTETQSLPTEHFRCLSGRLPLAARSEKVLLLKTAQVVASHSGFASVRDCCIPCVLCGSSAWQIEEVQGLDGSEILALVELMFMDSTICACPQRLMT